MSINKPYKRTIRQFTDEAKRNGGLWHYIQHNDFADSPEHYIRAYLIIQKDFLNLLDFIEPANKNLDTYSFRIHELLFRICIEVEANCEAILKENGYSKSGDWNMNDYRKINKSHKLSQYEVKLPVWKGDDNIRRPFEKWDLDKKPTWWGVYNKTKHSRHSEFHNADFKNLTDAMCGLIALLSAQFEDIDFAPTNMGMNIGGGPQDGMESAIGGYFRIKYPNDWDENEKYDFKWTDIKEEHNPIVKYNYE